MRTARLISSTLAAALLILMAQTPRNVLAAEAQPAAAQVTIDNFTFTPATITVKVGTPITWINHDDIPHTVVSDDKSFKSHVIDTDDKFTFTPTKAGTYTYFCSIHPKMTGTVVVQ